jgi:AP-3 complex subunit beta
LHFLDREQFQLGSLSHYINARANGYHDLPAFPDEPSDSSVRDVEPIVPVEETRTKKQHIVKKRSFYSESEQSSPADEGIYINCMIF